MSEGKIVRALDVGYGNVKFVRKHNNMEDLVECSMFPSMCLGASNVNLGGSALRARDTVVVTVDGIKYEVGKDIGLARGANDGASNLNKGFVQTPGYMARCLGALHYMFKEIDGNTIDYLIVGLPVNNIETNKEYLIGKLKGKHVLPGDKEVEIKEVKVYEQPLGAFFNFIYSPAESKNLKYEDVKNEKNLIIDPGMFTFDWMFIDHYKAVEKRSGATNIAMSAVIHELAIAVSKDLNMADDVDEVEKIIQSSLRDGKPTKIGKTVIDLDDYLSSARAVIDESVDSLANKVGKGIDIDNIMLVGGGARFFLNALQERYPDHEIITTNNSVYANVIGFQMSGERIALRDQVRDRKTTLATA